MSQLEEDMRQDFADFKQAYEKGEIVKGLRLLGSMFGEIAGLITIIIGALTVGVALSGGLAALGVPFATTAVAHLLKNAMPDVLEAYGDLDREDRKAVRAALHFLHIPNSFFSH